MDSGGVHAALGLRELFALQRSGILRLVTFQKGDEVRLGIERDERIVDLTAGWSAVTSTGVPSGMRELLALGEEGLQAARHVAEQGESSYAADEVKLLAPVHDPRKIICIGLNYRDHAEESGATAPPEPVVFCKYPSALVGPEADIVLPPVSKEVDYEAELVAVIGTAGRNIAKKDARRHIAGYTCGHDVSARDWQLKKPGGQWMMGKTFDTFAPLGPALVTADEVPDPHALTIRLRLNGEVMQDSNTSRLIFSVDDLVAYLSQVFTLEPGDLLFTGTPAGVGFARKPPVLLKAGDVTEVEIERLGTLRNRVVA
jgi:2-keto-4-pentenoate hydratase/2-oxohepta-3-ene-1,7-dioic acid hydratase in catechol pathway